MEMNGNNLGLILKVLTIFTASSGMYALFHIKSELIKQVEICRMSPNMYEKNSGNTA